MPAAGRTPARTTRPFRNTAPANQRNARTNLRSPITCRRRSARTACGRGCPASRQPFRAEQSIVERRDRIDVAIETKTRQHEVASTTAERATQVFTLDQARHLPPERGAVAGLDEQSAVIVL